MSAVIRTSMLMMKSEEMTMPPEPMYRTVWAVTSGEYSDFRVLAIFEWGADAEAAKALGMGDDVVELPYFPPGVVPQKHEYSIASGVVMHDNLDAVPRVYAYPQVAWTGTDSEIPAPRQRPIVTVDVNPVSDAPGSPPFRTIVRVVARSQASATKVCSDRLAKIRAEAIEHAAAMKKPKRAKK